MAIAASIAVTEEFQSRMFAPPVDRIAILCSGLSAWNACLDTAESYQSFATANFKLATTDA
jgi:hypothetical protein